MSVEDIDFTRASAASLYHSGEARSINPLRWERVRQLRFDDIVVDLTGKHGDTISCPFHGRDSTPSFSIYRGSNDAFCFGCPPGQQYYDAILFTSRYLGVSRVRALRWLEKKYDLEPIEDEEEDSAEELVSEIGFSDLSEPFIRLAAKDVQTHKSVELALEYLRIYFEAEFNRKEEPDQAALALAEVLGIETIKKIKSRKAR